MPRKKVVKKVQVNFRLDPRIVRKLQKLAQIWNDGGPAAKTVVITDLIELQAANMWVD